MGGTTSLVRLSRDRRRSSLPLWCHNDRSHAHAGRSCLPQDELVGSSSESLTNAIETAVERSIADPAQPRMVRVSEIRGHIQDGKVAHYQVTLKVGFRVEE